MKLVCTVIIIGSLFSTAQTSESAKQPSSPQSFIVKKGFLEKETKMNAKIKEDFSNLLAHIFLKHLQ